MSIALNNWKKFWIIRIDALKMNKGVHQNQLTENEGSDNNEVWKSKIWKKNTWDDIENCAIEICKEIYSKATKNESAFPSNNNELCNELQPLTTSGTRNYGQTVFDVLLTFEREIQEISQVFHDKIGIEFDNSDVVYPDGIKTPNWKHIINQKLPNKETKLTSIPAGKDISDLLYTYGLYQKIADDLPEIILKGLTGGDRIDKFGFNWKYKVNDTSLQEYKNSKTTITNAETHLGLNPGDLATITTNAAYNLNGKTLAQLLTPHTCPPCPQTHCPTAHANYDAIKGESAEYQRIHTKLKGKVSDSELDNLLNQTPTCSHTDYDTIKQERDDLKQQKDNYSTEKQQAIQDKEKEIINKIITDLGLTTERERERESIRSSNYGN